MKKTKILIISVGSMVAQNVLETLKHRRENIIILGTDASSDAPLYDCDKIYLVPLSELPPSQFSKVLSKIIQEESPDLIIPGRDIDVIILSMLRKDFPDISDRFISGETELAKLMEDKWLSYEFAHNESLPFAETIIYDYNKDKKNMDKFIATHGFPLIAKPRKGFASKGVFFVLNQEHLSSLSSDGSIILQEYLGDGSKISGFHESLIQRGLPLFYSVEEIKYSMQMYIGKSGELMGHIITKHQMKNGVSSVVTLFENHGLENLVQRYYTVFSKKGWYGPLNIQLQKSNKTGELKAYEFNGRFTGATASRYILGYDEIGFALEQLSSVNIGTDDSFKSQKRVLKQTYISARPEGPRAFLDENKVWSKKIDDHVIPLSD
nr:hypothetical protein [Allomuricauda sp.]